MPPARTNSLASRRPSEAFRVTLRPEGDGPPAANRLKLALKTLLRRHGLRAVEVEDVGGPFGGHGTHGDERSLVEAADGSAGGEGALSFDLRGRGDR